MTAPAAVGIDDDLTTGQPCITVWPANHKAAGGIDVVLGLAVEQFRGNHLTDDFLLHEVGDFLLSDLFCMLSGDHDGIHANWRSTVVLDRDLALAVRTQPVDQAFLADVGQTIDQAMREGDWHRHQFFRLVAGVSEHQALVAGSVLIHTLCDVRALTVQCNKHAAGVGVKTDVV